MFTRMRTLLEFNQEWMSYRRKASKTSTFTLSSDWVLVTKEETGTGITQQYVKGMRGLCWKGRVDEASESGGEAL